MRCQLLIGLAAAVSVRAAEEVLIDLDPGGLVWTGLDCDDDLALLVAFALNDSAALDLVGVTVCGGNAPIKHTAPGLKRLLSTAGKTPEDFKSGVSYQGHGWRTMHVAWPSLRKLNRVSFDRSSSNAAAQTIIRAAEEAGPAGLTVICLGPPSNLAAALRASPSTARRLRRVVLMGGELTGGKLDLNFMSDRAAARDVIASDVPTMIVPIQTCAQAAFTRDDVSRLEARCCPGAATCALTKKMRLQTQVMPWLVNTHARRRLPEDARWKASAGLPRGFVPWDVVALMAAARPVLFGEWEAHAVSVPPCAAEPCNGTMTVDPTPLQSSLLATGVWRPLSAMEQDRTIDLHRNVVTVPHLLRSEAALVDETIELLCAVPAVGATKKPASSAMSLGFMREAALIGAGTLAALFVAPVPPSVVLALAAAAVAHISGHGLRMARLFRRTDW